jgi:hypothetical protein
MKGFDYEALDPGIRGVVRRLHAAGFVTTDSGDGVSKPPDARVFDVPHIVVQLDPAQFFQRTWALYVTLGPDWRVEASYCPNDGSYLALATKT